MRRVLVCLLPLFALAVELGAAELGLGGYRFDPLQGLPPLPAGLAVEPQALAAPRGLVLVQSAAPVSDGFRAALVASGAEILDYVPRDAYLVWVEGGAGESVRALPGVRAMVPLAPAFKLGPETRALAGDPARHRLSLGLRRGSYPGTLEALLAGLGAELLWQQPLLGQTLARIEIAGSEIAALARLPEVISISRWQPSAIEGEVAKRIIDGSSGFGPAVAAPGYADFLAARGVDGSGVTVAVIDNGVDVNDPSGHFAGRVVSVLRGASEGSNGHGHHVAGIIAASCGHAPDGDGYHWGSGVAPAVGLLNIPRIRAGYTGTDAEQVRDAVTTPAANGVTASIAACSWNSGVGSDYTMEERIWDAFVRDADDLSTGNQELFVSFSVGNAGPVAGSLTRPHAGKNLVVVGNSVSYRPAFGFDNFNEIYSGAGASSRGPAADGRIKPDLVAPGTYVASAHSGASPSDCGPAIDGQHLYCTGSSMAQPHVAGAAALFTDWWQRTRGGLRPSPALVKAALINGARDLQPTPLGPPFSTSSVPNFDEGWGLLDLGASIAPSVATLHLDQRDVPVLHAGGESATLHFVLSDPDRPLGATLVWTDAPAAVGADPALVNDLDLSLAQGALRWLGNALVGGFSDPSSSAADRLNNVEVVRLARPPDGIFEARVLAASLPGDGIPGDADPTDQDHALVIANAELPAEAGRLRIVGSLLACNGSVEVLVWDRGATLPLAVRIASDTEPAGESIDLADPTGARIFTGSLPLDTGAPTADGRLQVRDGDILTLSYIDADDGMGGIDVLKTATARMDCRPPAITNVQVSEIDDRGATVTWETDEPATSEVELLSGATLTVASADSVTAHALRLEGLSECGRYRFRVRAVDPAGNGTSDDNGGPGHPFATWGLQHLYRADFEGDDGGFEHWGPLEEWGWGAPLAGPPGAASGDRLWGTRLDGNYAKRGSNLVNGNFLLLSPTIDLGPGAGARLRFRHWFDIATDGASDDGAWVEIWDGSTWRFVTPAGGYGSTIDSNAPLPPDATGAAWAGLSGGWREVEFDLGAFAGRQIRVKLQLFEEDNFLAGAPGWYVDDFEVFRFASCERGRIASLRPVLRCGGEVEVELRDSGLNLLAETSESAEVRVTSPSEPAGERLTLIETAANSSRFRASLPVMAGPALPDGRIAAGSGETLTLSYADVDDGSGRPATIESAVAVDCVPPLLGGLSVTALTDRSARVEWQTDELATSLVEWGDSPALGQRLEDRSLVRHHAVTLTGLSPCTIYRLRVASADLGGSVAGEDNGGALHGFSTWTGDGVALLDDFESDRGWTLDGEWQRGRPAGLAFATGNSFDPNAARSGLAVLGIDLSGLGARPGNYEADVAIESAVSPAIDLSRFSRVELDFVRWLGVGRLESVAAPADRAALDLSTDGGNNWSNLWLNPVANDVNDRFWEPQHFDLTAAAAGRPDVRLRFTLGSDAATEFMGWQIDDLQISDPSRPPWAPCASRLGVDSFRIDDSAGNNDGRADPGETVRLLLRLANSGVATATRVGAAGTSGAPGLGWFTTSAASFPDLAVGASGESLAPHLGLAVSAGARCGEWLPVTLALSALDSAATAAISLPIGAAQTRESTLVSPPGSLPIPDHDATGIASTLSVSEDEPLRFLEIAVAISHPDAGDLVVTLSAPDRSTLTLHNLSGAGAPWVARTYPTGSVPDGPGRFEDLLGRSLAGDWTLRVIDARRNGTGTLDGWSLRTVASDPTSGVSGPVTAPLLIARQGGDLHATWGVAAGAVAYALRKSALPEREPAVNAAVSSTTAAIEVGGGAAPGSAYYGVAGLDACGRMGP